MDSTPHSPLPGRVRDLPVQQRRAIRAWCMYDWANSAFATSGVAAIFPVYFVFLFKESLGESAVLFGLTFTGSSTWSFGVVISTAIVALTSPILGIVADRVPIKKALLGIYAAVGALFTGLAFLSAYTGEPWMWLFGMFTLANVGFAGSLVFYNAILPHLGPRHMLDEISSRGFAYGYAGGGLLLLIHLSIILLTQDSAFADLATRLTIASVGIWWFGWAMWSLKALPEPPIHRQIGGLTVLSALSLGFRELGQTLRDLRRFRVVLTFLAAYLLFNDGIQSVLAIAGAFAADTLGVTLVFNMATIVIIQFVGVPGAIAFSRLAAKTSTKSALIVALVGWIVVVMFGVALAPLPPAEHGEFDFQWDYRPGSNDYILSAAPDLPDSGFDLSWTGESWLLKEGVALKPRAVINLPRAIEESENVRYSLSVSGGPYDGASAVGPAHPSNLGTGPIDWWPTLVRSVLWGPLGLDAGYQWLCVGLFVGIVIGGSQALARSLFAQITPETRSGEFFSFFGFMSRASSVIGPTLYIVATAAFDTRVAVMSILIIIVAGTILLRWVNVKEGVQVALEETLRSQAGEDIV